MKLFIAEKPSLGKAIAEHLPNPHQVEKGYITCDNGKQVVTWGFGHMLEIAEPDFFTAKDIPLNKKGKKVWRLEDLPIIPNNWKLHSKKESIQQLKVIESLLKKCSSVVNAGDPDREGQLLIDEMLDNFQWKGKTERILLASLDDKSIHTALNNLKNNNDFVNLKNAALGRSRADWLVGINVTRALTVMNKALISAGRVQSAVLMLIGERDEKIAKFVSRDFYIPFIVCDKNNLKFTANWSIRDIKGVDNEGYLIDLNTAKSLITQVLEDKQVIVKDYQANHKTKNQPLGYSLSELQKVCSSKLGLSASDTLNVAQKLYEEYKTTSYPRSDCNYLSEEMYANAGTILKIIEKNSSLSKEIQNANVNIHSKIWNTEKVTAHHAIIPTEVVNNKMDELSQKVYDIIAKRYITQFYNPQKYIEIKIVLKSSTEEWTTSGIKTTEAGWKVIEKEEQDENELPTLVVGETLQIQQADIKKSKTNPPSHFTDGTLIAAMSKIYNYITDEEAKKKLKETSGIGTEATRANIIEVLLKRNYITRKGKLLLITDFGKQALKVIPDELKNPVTTARWEEFFTQIEQGNLELALFEDKIKSYTNKLIEKIKKTTPSITVSQNNAKAGPSCLLCKKPTKVCMTKTKKKWFKCESCNADFWPSKNGKACGTQWEKRV